MKSMRFIEALAYLDEDILENAICMREQFGMKRRARAARRRKQWLVIAACAACVCLLVVPLCLHGLSAVPNDPAESTPATSETEPSVSEPESSPAHTESRYTASQLAEMYVAQRLGESTRNYTNVYAPDGSLLPLTPLSEDERATIYHFDDSGKPLDIAELKAWGESRIAKLVDAVGMPLSGGGEGHETANTLELSWESDEYRLNLYQYALWNTVSLYTTDPWDTIALDGEAVAVLQTLDDAGIAVALAGVKEKLCAIFGVDFSDVLVRRSYDGDSENGVHSLDVYFYNKAAHPLNGIFTHRPLSDYIQLHFDNSRNYEGDFTSDTLLSDVQILYMQYRVTAEEHCAPITTLPWLTLAEAEVLLEKGWVLTEHYCRYCMQAQEPVDFTDYDYVSLEYWLPSGSYDGEEPVELVPFYTFYVDTGTAANGNRTFAKTSVPAVAVSGWEEYREVQRQKHPAG